MSVADLAKAVEQVRQLEALARSTPFPDEAENARRAANRLIVAHQLPREIIDAERAPAHRAARFVIRDGVAYIVLTDGSEVEVMRAGVPR